MRADSLYRESACGIWASGRSFVAEMYVQLIVMVMLLLAGRAVVRAHTSKAGYAASSTMAGITVRPSGERGHADHGWLNTYHTFSFAGYYDPKFQGYGPLRVINEDRVQSGEGFPTHGHSNYEIFSYVIDGALEHKDSMGNKEVIGRGAVQFTSGGTGITHSEYNADRRPSGGKDVHFLQIWAKPDTMNLKPAYQTVEWKDEAKWDKLAHIISPKKAPVEGTITINQNFNMWAGILSDGVAVTRNLSGPQPGTVRKAYLHVPQTVAGKGLTLSGVRLDGSPVGPVQLGKGDGAFIDVMSSLTIKGQGSTQ